MRSMIDKLRELERRIAMIDVSLGDSIDKRSKRQALDIVDDLISGETTVFVADQTLTTP